MIKNQINSFLLDLMNKAMTKAEIAEIKDSIFWEKKEILKNQRKLLDYSHKGKKKLDKIKLIFLIFNHQQDL